MSKNIKLKKGFNINLAGKAKEILNENVRPDVFALKPTDFIGMTRPKVKVIEGDIVKAGTPLLFDKMQPDINYCAPVSGEVVEVKRGAKRKLLEIKIVADKEIEYVQGEKYSMSDIKNLKPEEIKSIIANGGAWPQIVQRPYGIVADIKDIPKSIFISGFDSSPLAPNYNFILKDSTESFRQGIEVLSKLTNGNIYVNLDGKSEVPSIYSNLNGVQVNKFTGPHPSGNVGVQIHHLDPINKGDLIWTINPYGVAQIGKLFTEGIFDASKIIALTGSEVKEPQYYKTYIGAPIRNFTEGNLTTENVRYISGNVLTGENIGKEGFLGFYHHQFSVIPEGDYHEFLGWLKPTTSKLSFSKALGLFSFLNNKEFKLDTNTRGEKRAFVQTGVFEKVLPMDILPTHLLKAIMANDYDEMEALGIYEVIEEDLALCEFVDVSKHDVQQIIREGINLIKES